MTELPGWKNVIVPQRHETGCIPTGYEWLIRFLGIKDINLDSFQEEFDLGRSNNFNSVAARIQARYRHVDIRTRDFTPGYEKVGAIRQLLEKGTPCLISLALGEIRRTPNNEKIIHRGWHIMPTVRIDNQIKMIHQASERGNQTWELPIPEVIWRHDNMPGGKDIAWIEV